MQRALLLAAFAALLLAPATFAQSTHRVFITNITPNQIIGPPVIASHSFRTNIFKAGRPASPGLAAVAEDADSAVLVESLLGNEQVLDVVTGTGPILPGATAVFELEAGGNYGRLSAVGMLVSTNDAFFGLDSLQINGDPAVKELAAPGWDAGSEANNESCDFIPGPPCGNPFVRATDGAEGFVHIHPGIRGDGDLTVAGYDWLNPVVRIVVQRLDG